LIKFRWRRRKKSKMRLRTGVYMGVSGPNYETPAEIRVSPALAPTLSMTPSEAIVARQCAWPAGNSCITNRQAATKGRALLHQDVPPWGSKKDEMPVLKKPRCDSPPNLHKYHVRAQDQKVS